MRKDNEQLSDILQHEYTKKTGYYTHTEVPDAVIFEVDGYLLKVKYPQELILSNPNNTDSFEGWMMVCHRWGVFDKIQFAWEQANDASSPAYQQFLDRVQLFKANFSEWFQLGHIAQQEMDSMEAGSHLDDKAIIESIIDICWYFETSDKITIQIPAKWNLKLEKGVVEIKPQDALYGIQDALYGDEASVYTPWQLLINRWAYLPTAPQSRQNDLTAWGDMPEDVQNLIKVGFTERNFPFPAEY